MRGYRYWFVSLESTTSRTSLAHPICGARVRHFSMMFSLPRRRLRTNSGLPPICRQAYRPVPPPSAKGPVDLLDQIVHARELPTTAAFVRAFVTLYTGIKYLESPRDIVHGSDGDVRENGKPAHAMRASDAIGGSKAAVGATANAVTAICGHPFEGAPTTSLEGELRRFRAQVSDGRLDVTMAAVPAGVGPCSMNLSPPARPGVPHSAR